MQIVTIEGKILRPGHKLVYGFSPREYVYRDSLQNTGFCAIVALLLKRMTQEQEPGRKFRITPLEETDERITLQVSRAEGETLIVKFAPATKEVSFRLGAGEQVGAQEVEQQQAITIEGRIARNKWAKYDQEKRTYSNRIAHQYDATDTTKAWFYDIVAEGEAADQAFRLFLNQAGMTVAVSGVLLKEDVSEKTKGLIKADFIKRLPPGQKPSHTIVRERVKPPANGG
jgi:hypothetical protein